MGRLHRDRQSLREDLTENVKLGFAFFGFPMTPCSSPKFRVEKEAPGCIKCRIMFKKWHVCLFSIGDSPIDTPPKTAKESLALELEPLVSKPSPRPVHLDVPRPKREVSQESDTDSDYSPPTTIKKPHKGTTFAEGKKMGHHKQLSLYSWLSSPPTTSPPTTSHSKATAEGELERKTVGQTKGTKCGHFTSK